MTTKTIVVASQNPVKQEAVRRGFAQLFPADTVRIEGVSVPSGVSEQPLGDDETRLGAANRAQSAQQTRPDATYWAGIEGGCSIHDDGSVSVYAWIVVRGPDGMVGHSRTSAFFLPEEVAALVRDGVELGPADDAVFGRTNSKQSTGSVGLLTGDVITRADYYAHAVALALIPFHTHAQPLTFPAF